MQRALAQLRHNYSQCCAVSIRWRGFYEMAEVAERLDIDLNQQPDKEPAGTPQVVLQGLPTRSATDADVDTKCDVCLSSFEEGEVLRTLPCEHAFHSSCIDRWLLGSKSATCPCCRFNICAKKVDTCCEVTRERPVPWPHLRQGLEP